MATNEERTEMLELALEKLQALSRQGKTGPVVQSDENTRLVANVCDELGINVRELRQLFFGASGKISLDSNLRAYLTDVQKLSLSAATELRWALTTPSYQRRPKEA